MFGKSLARLTIFTGSFVVFLLEPMVANLLTPAFGGTATVWTVTLATFQALLLAGYALAHALGRPAAARTGGALRAAYLALLVLCGAWLAYVPGPADAIVAAVRGGLGPIPAVFAAIVALVGVPFVALSANASFVQSLVARDRSAYNLYGVSNLGSFAGLLAYPLVFEPFLDVDVQVRAAGALVLGYAALLAALVWGSGAPRTSRPTGNVAPRTSRPAGAGAWFGLSALSTFALNAVTTHLCLEIAPLPMMWAFILALYLLTYAVAFSPRGARFGEWAGYPLVALVAVAAWFVQPLNGAAFFAEVALVAGLLFVGCWNVHARLYALRPDEGSLTAYYLVLAVGGAVGGVVSSMVCPLLFDSPVEYPVTLALLLAVPVGGLVRRFGGRREILWGAMALVAFVAQVRGRAGDGVLVHQSRNFYGLSAVRHRTQFNPMFPRQEMYEFLNNGTTHGKQFADGTARSRAATTYYTSSGGGACIERHPLRLAHRPLRAGFLGLGVGTLATYGERGDVFRFFEINPDVVRIAKDPRYFDFLEKSWAKVEVVTDDARLALEAERRAGAEKYDLLLVDVFSGDSIPAHLATREALDLYLDRLEEEGILAFHLTNWHLNLLPMVKAMAAARGLHLYGYVGLGRGYGDTTIWACLSRREIAFGKAPDRQTIDFGKIADIPLMTDRRHSLVPYLSAAPFALVPCKED